MNSRSRNNLLLNWLLNTVVLFKNETLDNVIDIISSDTADNKTSCFVFPCSFSCHVPFFPQLQPAYNRTSYCVALAVFKVGLNVRSDIKGTKHTPK